MCIGDEQKDGVSVCVRACVHVGGWVSVHLCVAISDKLSQSMLVNTNTWCGNGVRK